MQTTGVVSKGRVLQGKVAIVTGAGSGVGRAIAKLFAEQGSNVVIVDVVPDRVNEVVTEVSATGSKTKGMVLDLGNRPEPDKMIDEAQRAFGRVDILCNNAGIMDGVRPVGETPDEVWERVLNVNLNAPFRATRKVIPLMLKQGGGAILNTASVAGVFGGMAGVSYTVSKHALIGLTRSTAAHYGTKGIRCNAMILGGVNTNIGLGAAQPNPLGLELLSKMAATIPRMGEPIEIARLALFLVSDDASYVNGSCIVIDGGWTNF